MTNDKNFDDLADRFESRIYSGLKGDLRQAVIGRDLTKVLSTCPSPLDILDTGGGLGHFAIQLAGQGHRVTYNDLSAKMMAKAQTKAELQGSLQTIHWLCCPYQQLIRDYQQHFDFILCHALVEWLQEPQELIPRLAQLLKPQGKLSFCFYNPAGLVYHNLIRGNFHYLEQLDNSRRHTGGLTPTNPCSLEQIEQWLAQAGFAIESSSGIRVFSDYVLEKRGGNQSEEDVTKQELQYSQLEPYKRLGRYLHLIATLK